MYLHYGAGSVLDPEREAWPCSVEELSCPHMPLLVLEHAHPVRLVLKELSGVLTTIRPRVLALPVELIAHKLALVRAPASKGHLAHSLHLILHKLTHIAVRALFILSLAVPG